MTDIDFKPAGPVRPNQIYLSWRLHKALGYAARKTGVTREDLAEVVLTAWVDREHPDIGAWLTKRETEEKQFVSQLKPNAP